LPSALRVVVCPQLTVFVGCHTRHVA
jgi:hypothetical protein